MITERLGAEIKKRFEMDQNMNKLKTQAYSLSVKHGLDREA